MNIYHRGAQDGLLIGILLSVIFLLHAWSLRMPMLGLAGTLVLLSLPFVAYWLISRTYKSDEGRSRFSALWMQGIIMFLCGGLIMGLVICLYIRFVSPDLISDQLAQSVEAYRQIDHPTAQQLADQLQLMAKTPSLLPSPIQMAFASIWTVGFFGSMTSLIIAAVIKYIVKYRK